MAILMIFGVMLIFMLMRVALPIGTKVEGKLVKEIKLGIYERLILQRVNIYSIAVFMVIAAASGLVSGLWEMMIVVGAFAILLIPVRYKITTAGIAINNVVFRPWSDFTGTQVSRRHLRLLAKEGMRPFDLHVMGSHQTEAIGTIKRFLAEPSSLVKTVKAVALKTKPASGR